MTYPVHNIRVDSEVAEPDPGDDRPIFRIAFTYPVTETLLVRSADPIDALTKAHTLVRDVEGATFKVIDSYEYIPIT